MLDKQAEMTESEAQQAVQSIRESVENIGLRLLDLRERQGWRALGYHSFTAMLREEFTYSRQHLYRLMNAAQPKELSHNVTTSTPDEKAIKEHLEALESIIAEAKQSQQAALAALEDVRRVLEPKGLYEAWCRAEFGMLPGELIASFDLEANGSIFGSSEDAQ